MKLRTNRPQTKFFDPCKGAKTIQLTSLKSKLIGKKQFLSRKQKKIIGKKTKISKVNFTRKFPHLNNVSRSLKKIHYPIISDNPYSQTDETDLLFKKVEIKNITPMFSEYKAIKTLVGKNQQIVAIHKVVHPENLKRFLRKKSEMKNPNPTMVWHGTSANDPHYVATEGADVRASHSGRIFGAVNVTTSLNGYSHRSKMKNNKLIPDRFGNYKTLLLCRFLLGKSDMNFYSGYFRHSLGKKKPRKFPDSGYSNGMHAYCVYSNEQVYVNYIVDFKCKEPRKLKK